MADRPPKTRKKTEPRRRGAPVVDRVFQETLRLLAERGPAGVSVPEVAVAAGLNKTSVYRRWPTREALLSAALGASLAPAAPLPDTGAFRTDLLAYARGVLAFAQSPLGKGVMRMLLAQQDVPPLRALTRALVSGKGPSGPRELLARAVRRGELAPGVDLSLLLSVVAGTLLQRLVVEGRAVPAAFLEQLVDLVVRGAAPGDAGLAPVRPRIR